MTLILATGFSVFLPLCFSLIVASTMTWSVVVVVWSPVVCSACIDHLWQDIWTRVRPPAQYVNVPMQEYNPPTPLLFAPYGNAFDVVLYFHKQLFLIMAAHVKWRPFVSQRGSVDHVPSPVLQNACNMSSTTQVPASNSLLLKKHDLSITKTQSCCT